MLGLVECNSDRNLAFLWEQPVPQFLYSYENEFLGKLIKGQKKAC